MGICCLDVVLQIVEWLQQFVDNGYYGDMCWMEECMYWCGNVVVFWFEVKLVIMLVEFYMLIYNFMDVVGLFDCVVISVYVQNCDYYDMVKKWFKKVGRWLLE